jgi:hypothetical protein
MRSNALMNGKKIISRKGVLVQINLFVLKKAKINTIHLAAHTIFEK